MSWLWNRRGVARFHESVLNAFDSAIMVESVDRVCLHTNRQFVDMFRIPVQPRELIGMDCRAMAEQAKQAFRNPEYFKNKIERLMRDRVKVLGDVSYLADGRCLERDFIPVYEKQKYIGHLWVYRDITDLHKDSVTDEMTGLYNRRGLEMFAAQYLNIARRDRAMNKGTRLFMVFADINGLKKVNDKYGHAAGDSLIVDAAKALRSCFRDTDIVCRLGGDEYVAMAVGENITREILQERMAAALRVRNLTALTPYELSISFGVHEWAGEDLAAMISTADNKMYQVKGSK